MPLEQSAEGKKSKEKQFISLQKEVSFSRLISDLKIAMMRHRLVWPLLPTPSPPPSSVTGMKGEEGNVRECEREG